MENKISEKLTCPSCSARDKTVHPLIEGTGQINCPRCKATYPVYNDIIDFVGESSREITKSQWAMEFKPIVVVYERFWRPLVTRPFSDLFWEMETATRLLDLSTRHDLLDIACGTGNFTRLFSDTIRDGTITGIDLSLPMIMEGKKELEKRNITNITLMRVDVTKWPFGPDFFDRIHCAGALHLFPDIQSIFHSIFRSLKPGGIFVGATYVKGKKALIRLMQNAISFRSGFHWFEPEELCETSRRAGFVEWEQHINKLGIIFCARKKIA
jgi:ubiquinone/menaquinone biosynthesis C-methylase UbiE